MRRPYPHGIASPHGFPIALLGVVLLSACGGGEEAAPPAGELSTLPGYEERQVPEELRYQLERVDPDVDGWDTEAFNSAAGARLGKLKKLLAGPAALTAADLADLVDPGFACAALRPAEREVAFRDPALMLARYRAPEAESEEVESGGNFQGAEGLAAALGELLAPFTADEHRLAAVKVIHVTPRSDGEVTTEVLWEISGPAREGFLQLSGTWLLTWRSGSGDGGDDPRLTGIAVERHEEALDPRGGPDGGRWLAEETERVLGAEPSFRRQLAWGQTAWGGALDVALGVDILGHHGLAVGDVNGDGRDDLYVLQGGGLPNRLYVQQPDGTAKDTAAEAGVDYLDRSTGALFLDFDADGDQDLVVAAGPLVFHANDGEGRFTVEAVVETFNVMSLAAADADGDGDLDLYACRYSSPEHGAPTPYHDANNGQPNQFFRNDGPWRFTDATAEVGLDENNRRYSFAAAWEDYDGDGDPDLYVANDFGRNNLYRNDGGRFTDVAAAAGVEDISAGMGVTWGDPNLDGRPDLYVSNMFSSAGHRIAYQRRFQEEAAEAVRGLYRRHARGNSLFLAAADGGFRDATLDAGVNMGRWAWGSLFADLNNDGLEDLPVANGYLTNEDYDDL